MKRFITNMVTPDLTHTLIATCFSPHLPLHTLPAVPSPIFSSISSSSRGISRWTVMLPSSTYNVNIQKKSNHTHQESYGGDKDTEVRTMSRMSGRHPSVEEEMRWATLDFGRLNWVLIRWVNDVCLCIREGGGGRKTIQYSVLCRQAARTMAASFCLSGSLASLAHLTTMSNSSVLYNPRDSTSLEVRKWYKRILST